MRRIALALGLTILLCGCTKSENTPPDTFRVCLDKDPDSMDWQLDYDRLHENLAEGLIQYDLTSTPPVLQPALAKSWSSSQRGRIWTFTLRDDVLWSDGTKFKGEDVVSSWKRLLDPKTGSRYAYQLFAIKNAREFYQKRVDFGKVGIRLIHPYTLEVELSKPLAFFPALLTLAPTFPVRTDLMNHLGADWAKPGQMVSLGPYLLKQWDHDRKIILVRNDSYYGPKPKVRIVDLCIASGKETQLSMFEAGKLDQVFYVPALQADHYQDLPSYRVMPETSIYYLGITTTKPPLNSELVRQALAHSIDRKAIGQILHASGDPVQNWIPPGVLGYDDAIGLNFDPEAARALLKKAGITQPLEIEIALYPGDDAAAAAQLIQAQLKKALGWTVSIRTQDFKILRYRFENDPPNTFIHGWTADYLDPDTFFSLLLSYSSDNHTHWKDPQFDRLVEDASQTLDEGTRIKLYHQAQKRLIEEQAVVVPLYVFKQGILSASRVKKYAYNPLEKMIFKYVELESE